MIDARLVDTLVSILPLLTTDNRVATIATLHLLDFITDDAVGPSSSSREDRNRRRLAIQHLCRVACVRVLWNVLIESETELLSNTSSSQVALNLLYKITRVIDTAAAAKRLPLAMQQVVNYTLGRMPCVEKILGNRHEDDVDQISRDQYKPHVTTPIARLMVACVQRWRGINPTVHQDTN